MTRANNKVGQCTNRGALNPPIGFGSNAPYSIYTNHLWVDTSKNIIYRHNGAAWVNISNSVRYKIKASDETVYNSAVVQNDNDLVLSLEANTVFEIEAILFIEGDGATNFQCDWVASGGVSQLSKRSCVGPADLDTGYAYNHHGTFMGLAFADLIGYSAVNLSSCRETFLVQTAATGTLQLRWAQLTAGLVNTKLLTGSYVKAQLVNSF